MNIGPERWQIDVLLKIRRETKPAVYVQLYESTDWYSLNYWLELMLSAGIATLGLVLNSPAVVIGAMLVSPLMGPILALGLALTVADLYLGLRASLLIAGSVVAAVLLSAGTVWLLPFHVPTPEILARTQPNLLDLGVALLSGLAGSMVICRGGGGGGVTALPGVAIAVALMPPLCAVGFGIGSGFSVPIMNGAMLLFTTNLAAITATAFLTFLLARMDAAEVHQQVDLIAHEHEDRDRLYSLLKQTVGMQVHTEVGRPHWRVTMVLVMLGLLFVPLRRALLQVRDETIARLAVADAIRALAPTGAVVSQRVDPTTNPILVRLVVTTGVSEDQIHAAELAVARRTGRNVDLGVRRVAGDDELAVLRQNLQQPPTAAPAVFSLDRIREEARSHLEGPIKTAWPEQSAELLGSALSFEGDEVVLHLRYQAARPLDTAVEQVLANTLKTQLGAAQLRVVLDYQRPPRTTRSTTSPPR